MKAKAKDDEEKRLQRNTTDRRRYADLSQDKKDAMLLKRRQRYAEKKSMAHSTKTKSASNTPEVMLLLEVKETTQPTELRRGKDATTMQLQKNKANLSQDKKDAILLKRRQRYAEKKSMTQSIKAKPDTKTLDITPLLEKKNDIEQSTELLQDRDANTMQRTKKKIRLVSNDHQPARYQEINGTDERGTQHKKDALLLKRRQRYAEKKNMAQLAKTIPKAGSHQLPPLPQSTDVINQSTGKSQPVTKTVRAFKSRPQLRSVSKGIVIKEVGDHDLTGQRNQGPVLNSSHDKGKAQISYYTSFDKGSSSSSTKPTMLSPTDFLTLHSDFPFPRMREVRHITQITYLETKDVAMQNPQKDLHGTAKIVEADIPSKKRKRSRVNKGSSSCRNNVLDNIGDKPLTLPATQPCKHCGAKRFHREPDGFCCSAGQVALLSNTIPDKLYNLYTSNSEDSDEFRTYIRTYNSSFSFTSFGVKYDKDLCRRNNGIYTFKIQGQVYHYINELLPSDNDPSYLQLYFYDSEHEIDNRMRRSTKLKSTILEELIDISKLNPYARFFRSLHNITDWTNQKVIIRADPNLDQRVYNSPSSSQVAAIWLENSGTVEREGLHIMVYNHSGYKHRVRYHFGCYDSLQYPLLFPFGEPGWHHGIQRVYKHDKKLCRGEFLLNPNEMSSSTEIIQKEEKALDAARKSRREVSCREYYSYKLQIRPQDKSILLRAGRLLQQYVVDMYVKIETSRLDYYRVNQDLIRSEVYQGVKDSIAVGETRASKIGKRVILPAKFIGGPRDMRKRYMDAMTLVQKFGKPDLFLTMTCNPNWPEIKSNLRFGDEQQNRPDLCARVFREKLECLKDDLIKEEVLGPIAAWTYVIEYQKRGLPHVHFLLIFKKNAKLVSPDAYDKIVSAELPDKNTHPHLYEMVVKHMMHGPCGVKNPQNVCMKRGGSCKNRYPKNFCSHTTQGNDSYPIYRRRDDGKHAKVRKHVLDNRWVVPYNAYLLAKYDCHINVEVCSSIKAVKYLYKYIYKGHDQIAFNIVADEKVDTIDEIERFQSARWISAVGAMWRIYRFALNEMRPAVQSLQLHLDGKQLITFKKYDKLQNIAKNDRSRATTLTEFFNYYKIHRTAEKYLYKEFPEHFVWDQQKKVWTRRKQKDVIGRIVAANPSEGERYYLRLLLNHVRGPTSYEHLRTCQNCIVATFREAALLHGLLESDTNLEQCLQEAISYQMPETLRRLFATILVYCNPNNPTKLWDSYELAMSEDYKRKYPNNLNNKARAEALRNINSKLETMGKTIRDYALSYDETLYAADDNSSTEIEAELNVVISDNDLNAWKTLNPQQKHAYDTITKRIFLGEAGAFFIDGPGGTGKTYLYCALLATIRSKGYVGLATATSGVAASILPGGRTTHSRFKIPINIEETHTCNVSKQSGLAKLIRSARLIIWDEASMAKRQDIEAFENMLQDVNDCPTPFGGKVIVFGGDFRQVLPVVPKATKEESIDASLIKSNLWSKLEKIRLIENMRAKLDASFTNFLLRIGNGIEQCTHDDKIRIPQNMLVPFSNNVESIKLLAEHVFPQLPDYANDPTLMTYRAILTPTNDYVDDINSLLINNFPGKITQYKSFDTTLDTSQQGLHEDFLNTLSPKGLPPHILELKPNCPVILLRNIDPPEGLSNGTRLICRTLTANLIYAEIAVGSQQGKKVFLPRIPLQPSDNAKYPIPFQRKQFPVRLCFAMTINKAQGQTLENVGIYLPRPVFSHGQLYVALSRARTSNTVKVMIKPTSEDETDYNCTKNVVFQEVLTLAET